jgi:hypothetical protein
MSDLRGLPTRVDGITYRSRTEARHVLFFKHMGLLFDYEPQGYAAMDIAYLPDFLVFAACGPLWVEIKWAMDADPDGVERWRKFANVRPRPDKTRAALITGQPAIEPVNIVIGGDEGAGSPSAGPWEADNFTWRPCPAGIHFDLAYPGKFRSKFAEDGCPPDPGNGGEQRIAQAVYIALSAKFTGRDNRSTPGSAA